MFMVAAFVLTVSTSASDFSIGKRQDGDDLVCHHHVKGTGRRCFIVYTMRECYLTSRYNEITQIVVQEYSPSTTTNRKGTAEITDGGVGQNFVKFRLFSFRNLPLKFDIYVYASKYQWDFLMPAPLIILLDYSDYEVKEIDEYKFYRNCMIQTL